MSSQTGNRRAACVCGRWPEHCPGRVPEFPDLMRSEAGPDCTTRQRNTHINDVREVRYPFHPWHGRCVLVQAVRLRNGPVVFQCRTDDDRGFPVLEIPQWMFDAAECCRIAVSSRIVVRCEALRHLRVLLAEAQQSSWIPGGADAEVVETERRSAESVPSADPESGVAAGSEPKDRESTSANAERTRREIPGSTERGER